MDTQAQQAEKRRLFSVLDAIDQVVYVSDPQTHEVLYANEAVRKLVGSDPIGSRCYESLQGEQTPCAFCTNALILGENLGKNHLWEVQNQITGQWFRCTDRAIEWFDGRWVRFEVAFDITDRKEAQERLQKLNQELSWRVEQELSSRLKSEQLYKNIFKNSPEGIMLIDRQGALLYCNQSGARMLGYKPEALIGKSLFGLSDRPRLDRVFEGHTERFEWEGRTSGGERLEAEMILTPSGTSDDEILCIWRDMTAFNRLQKERELEQAILIQQTKLADLGNMIGAIAHQWRQPLNAISLMAQDLPDAMAAGELDQTTIQTLSDRFLEQVRFMSQTLDDFRNFYRPARQAEPFDAKEEIAGVITLLKAQMRQYSITTSIQGESASIIGHAGEFKQVVLNLLNNAKESLIQSHQAEPRIDIQLTHQGGMLVLAFCDNGCGIDDDILASGLFEAFVTTKGEAGTGVGLWLSRTIIERMNGTITAQNRSDGACFEIVLPLAGGDGV